MENGGPDRLPLTTRRAGLCRSTCSGASAGCASSTSPRYRLRRAGLPGVRRRDRARSRPGSAWAGRPSAGLSKEQMPQTWKGTYNGEPGVHRPGMRRQWERRQRAGGQAPRARGRPAPDHRARGQVPRRAAARGRHRCSAAPRRCPAPSSRRVMATGTATGMVTGTRNPPPRPRRAVAPPVPGAPGRSPPGATASGAAPTAGRPPDALRHRPAGSAAQRRAAPARAWRRSRRGPRRRGPRPGR